VTNLFFCGANTAIDHRRKQPFQEKTIELQLWPHVGEQPQHPSSKQEKKKAQRKNYGKKAVWPHLLFSKAGLMGFFFLRG